MTVTELKELIEANIPEENNDCEIVVSINGTPMEITGITHHRYYTKPGGLPYEIQIR